MRLDWQATYPGRGSGAAAGHSARGISIHCWREPLPQIPLDGELVEHGARDVQPASRWPARVFAHPLRPRRRSAVPPWRPSDALGAAGARMFVRASGKPLTDGIPGFFTVDGFQTVLLPSLAGATKQVAESWVLGARVELAIPTARRCNALERDVIALYEADYAKTWDAMLADLNVVPLRSLSQAAQDLYILASPQSPMRGAAGLDQPATHSFGVARRHPQGGAGARAIGQQYAAAARDGPRPDATRRPGTIGAARS